MLGLTAVTMVALLAGPELAPGTRYDEKIPTLQQVLGHETGEEITSPEGMVSAMRVKPLRAAKSTETSDSAFTIAPPSAGLASRMRSTTAGEL